MNVELLKKAGIDYDRGVTRFLDDVELYESVLVMFLEDTTFPDMLEAYKVGDTRALFRAAHSLKGACGNMDMTLLFEKSSALTEYLRGNDSPDMAVIERLFADTKSAYENVVGAIKNAV